MIKELKDNMNDISKISVSILDGLKDMVEKQQSHQTNLMTQLFKDFFPLWLTEIRRQVDMKNNSN